MRRRSKFAGDGKVKDYDLPQDSLAQKRAVESVSNVANWDVWGDRIGDVEAAANEDAELAAIVSALRDVGTPLAVAEVAEGLRWDSEKAAKALARGGERGVLRFSRDGDLTTVALAED